MEFALHPAIPNFAGGLGVLATDILRSAADLEIPMIGVSLIYHWDDNPKKAFPIADYFEPCPERTSILIEGRAVQLSIWKYEIIGQSGFKVPIYFLDSYLPENLPWDRDLTKELYSTNQYTRLCQEAILGIGGVRMLRALGYGDIDIFHMNEGHASLLTFERLLEEKGDEDKVKSSCVFTTHTPIPAGHDRFPYPLALQVLDGMEPHDIKHMASPEELHTTKLALHFSRAVNGVSRRHAGVCKEMFPAFDFLAITNGIHLSTWAGEATAELLDRHLPEWRKNPFILKNALELPDEMVKKAHQKNKKSLVDFLNSRESNLVHSSHHLQKDDYFDEETLTITFSRRFVEYKRPLLLFRDLNRLRDLAYQKIQVIFSGVCHPDDQYCNVVMSSLQGLQKELRGQIRLAVMPDRNLDTSKLLAAGSDVWLNNPQPPMEACGTSGMKAALNGGINLSSLDGWWIEAMEMDPESGWSIKGEVMGHDQQDAEALYETLEKAIDLYYNDHPAWVQKMKHSMALLGHFNTHRVVGEYANQMWNPNYPN